MIRKTMMAIEIVIQRTCISEQLRRRRHDKNYEPDNIHGFVYRSRWVKILEKKKKNNTIATSVASTFSA